MHKVEFSEAGETLEPIDVRKADAVAEVKEQRL